MEVLDAGVQAVAGNDGHLQMRMHYHYGSISLTSNGPMHPSLSRTHRLFALVLTAAAPPVWSQGDAPPAVEVKTLPPVVVTGQATGPGNEPGHRTDVSLDPATLPSAHTTVSRDEMSRTNVGRDISNLFRRVPGVLANNIDQGDTGNGFRMRGFTTQGTHGADVAVYVDGMPQNMPSSEAGAGHGPAFLEWLTPQMLGRLTVIKGPVSALFGDQNRGGAVDILTVDGADVASSAGVTLESYNGRRATAVLSTPLASLRSLLVADAYRSDSFRDQASSERDNLMWKLSGRHGEGEYSLRLNHYRSDFTAAGYLRYDRLVSGQVQPTATEEGALPGFGSGERTMVVAQRRPAQGEGGVHASVYAEDFERVRGGIAGGANHNVGRDDRRIWGARVLHNTAIADTASVAFGTELRHDRGEGVRQRHVNYEPSTQYLTNLHLDLLTYGVFAQGQWKPVSTLKLLGGVRWDRFDYEIDNRKLPAASTGYQDDVVTPRLGAAWLPLPRLEIFANAAEGFRSPAAQQISPGGALGPLGAPGGSVNDDIGPSKVRSYDVGFTARPVDGWTFGATWHRTLNEDELTLVAPDSWQSVGSTTRQGFEVETRWQAHRLWSVYASYGGIRKARVNNPSAGTAPELAVPRHQWKAGAMYKAPVGGGVLTVNTDAYLIKGTPYYSGTPLARQEMPVYTRYDLRAGYQTGPWQVTGFVVLQPHRFSSEAAYATAAGLWVSPQPRHHLGVSAQYTF
jgi:outer membrane receptor protein involved in Fe transport